LVQRPATRFNLHLLLSFGDFELPKNDIDCFVCKYRHTFRMPPFGRPLFAFCLFYPWSVHNFIRKRYPFYCDISFPRRSVVLEAVKSDFYVFVEFSVSDFGNRFSRLVLLLESSKLDILCYISIYHSYICLWYVYDAQIRFRPKRHSQLISVFVLR
jgi:hypothetical protein